jgi:site-specific recombinase XerD
MKLSLCYQPTAPASASPYRLVGDQHQAITWANDFLDAQRIRQLSLRSLRAYGYDLLHFARWWLKQPPRNLTEVNDSTLLDYVRHQLNEDPKPTPQTINHRLGVVRSLYRFHSGRTLPAGASFFQHAYTTRSPLGYGRPRQAVVTGLRLKQHRRVIVPLSADEVAKFWGSFHSFRDLALVGLMLLDGLRSHEALALRLEDLQLAEAQIRVLGKECHSYCISFRRRIETTIIHSCRQAYDLAFSSVDVFLVARTGIGLDRYTDAPGAGRVAPMSEPYPA